MHVYGHLLRVTKAWPQPPNATPIGKLKTGNSAIFFKGLGHTFVGRALIVRVENNK